MIIKLKWNQNDSFLKQNCLKKTHSSWRFFPDKCIIPYQPVFSSPLLAVLPANWTSSSHQSFCATCYHVGMLLHPQLWGVHSVIACILSFRPPHQTLPSAVQLPLPTYHGQMLLDAHLTGPLNLDFKKMTRTIMNKDSLTLVHQDIQVISL